MKTYEEVRQILSMIEPTEESFSKSSAEDLPHLQRMLHDPEPWRAARAVHAASRLGSVGATELVRSASTDTRREVRAAAATAAQRMSPEIGNQILETLLDDNDLSVKKLAIKSVGRNASPALLKKLQAISEREVDTNIKQLAGKQLLVAR